MVWDSPPSESLYGLGHYNHGVLDYRLAPVQLRQWNLWKVSPLLVSTRGWGILQETSYAEQDLNPVEESEAVALSAWTHAPTPQNSTATGSFVAKEAGAHWLYLELAAWDTSGAWCQHGVRVRVEGIATPVIDLFADPCNLPPSTIGRVELAAGTHTLVIESWDTQLKPPAPPAPPPGPAKPSCPPGKAPEPQPCPSHKNRTFCASDPSPSQCDHPPKPACPPCPPGPPPAPPPAPPAPPPGQAYKLWVRAPSYNRTSWRINRPGQRSTDYYFMSAAKKKGSTSSSIARAVALYRQATGEAPMPPKPILGFTMSKDR